MAGLCYSDPTFLLYYHIDGRGEENAGDAAAADTYTTSIHNVPVGGDVCSRVYSATLMLYLAFLAVGALYCLKQLCWSSNKFSMHKEVIQTCFLSIVVGRLSLCCRTRPLALG